MLPLGTQADCVPPEEEGLVSTRWKWVHLLGAAVTLALLAGSASAASITTTLAEFTGDPITVELTLDDASAGPGRIAVAVSVVAPNVGDIRGVLFDLADDSLLPGLRVDGTDVTGWDVSGAVIDLGQGANLHGGGSPCPCDFGVQIGTPGIGGDDIASTRFVLSHESAALTLADFAGQYVGVRVTSVGDDREGSSKTVALVPEPASAGLVLLGLAVLGTRRRPPAAPR